MAATTTAAGRHATGSAAPQNPEIQRGAEWLLRSTGPGDVFTPEQLTDEHRLIGQTAAAFVDHEVLPQLDRLEQKDWDVARQLVRRSGELGLLGVDAAETYGGVGLDKVTSLIVSEKMARSASFGATFGAQSNLTIIPISLFGTDAQKQKYLPRLIGGEIIGAYGLSETGSGSDALGARTRAASQPDGSFVLNGEKMWITNGGFADLFVVFAKVDGEQFTAFLVERSAGVKSGNEEHKMGLNGSSTTALIFQDVKVPADAVLGEIGKGHKVAFNVLNFARFKLGAACEGGAQGAIAEAAKYAAERRQFGQPIGSFGAIKHKIGEMVVRTYAIESLLYRTAGLVDQRIAATPHEATDGSAALAAFEEYAIEASIAKVAASEALDFVLDENIQIHGGNGYVRDYPAERHFRDARVNRIFEGTNEINRLLIPGMLARRATKNELPVIAAAKALQEELLGPSSTLGDDEGPLADERRSVESFKKTALMVFGLALQTYGQTLGDQQEVLMHIADIMMEVFAAESALLRALAASSQSAARASLHADAARVFVNDAAMRIDASAKQSLAATADGDPLRTMLAALRRLSKTAPINTAALRRRIADETVSRGGYPFV
ncbi:MAG TPA: acyl-CoA dehydrogenase family protein [Vicinamibacterales bacterium]|nr:acyl-CoA dehydrogenase family protein [Vicinamibacterales bacterium]